MHQHVRFMLLATYFMTGPAWSNDCAANAPEQVGILEPDCAVASAFEASFGLKKLLVQSIVLTRRRVMIESGKPTNMFEYNVFLVNDAASSQIAYDFQSVGRLRNEFETALKSDVCQINGVADAARDGTSFAIDVRFFLPGDNENDGSTNSSRLAAILIDSCEAN
jgi:hypothetical protein